LWLGKRWAEWFTVVALGIYIPVELYELSKGFGWVKLGLLVVNLVIVAYVARVLWRTKRDFP
jgi:uncharacterized membrane protein (DUF2068 family)